MLWTYGRICFSHLRLIVRNEERNYITVALRLYLSGTSRKDTWSSKVLLVSVCLVSVSVSLGFGFYFFVSFFFVSRVDCFQFGGRRLRVKKVPSKVETLLFL